MNSNTASPESPCIRECCLDDDNICLGCFRSLNEITHWTQVDEKTRRQFLNNAESRQKAHKNSFLNAYLIEKA